jgi:hypothetical protein
MLSASCNTEETYRLKLDDLLIEIAHETLILCPEETNIGNVKEYHR